MVHLLIFLAVALQGGGETPAPSPTPETVEITIIHTAGFRSAFDKAPIIRRIVQEERAGGLPVLVVDTGNHMDPASLETTLSEGAINVDIMNQIGYDAMVIGMGELQYGRDEVGRESISKRLEQARFPLLSANLYSLEEGGERRLVAFPGWACPRRLGGLRVGLIGVTSLEGGASHAQRRVRKRFSAGPQVEAVERAFKMLRNKVDLVVVLSNCGNQIDFALAMMDLDLLVGVSAVDLADPRVTFRDSRMVRTPQGGEYLGKIRLRVRRDPLEVIDLEYESVRLEGEGSPELAEEITRWREWIRGDWDQELGEVAAGFTPERSADLVADLVRRAARADIAFCDTAEIVRPLPEGAVTKVGLWALLPRRRPVVRFELQGDEIRRFLEENVRQGVRYRLSGVKCTYDPLREEGDQLTSVQIGREPLRGSRKYRCAADGGTVGSSEFFPAGVRGTEVGVSVHHVLEEHFRAAEEPVTPPDDERARREIPGG